jgi:hypothetical protein
MPSSTRRESARPATSSPSRISIDQERPAMATADPKNTPSPAPGSQPTHPKGVKIFTYPKMIFMLPTMIAALICGIGMSFTPDLEDPTKNPVKVEEARIKKTNQVEKAGKADTPEGKAAVETPISRFRQPQNLFGTAFLLIFAINMIIMAIDFPRFTIVAIILAAAALGFFFLWLNAYLALVPALLRMLEGIFAVANAGFYFAFAIILIVVFAIVWVTRYLDYWEVLPNEILHNHGPFSDLDRYSTMNLTFNKEIPDILEYALLRSGRLVFHFPTQNRSVVLDNVLWIDSKEEKIKRLMSRMEVRVTTDKEADDLS